MLCISRILRLDIIPDVSTVYLALKRYSTQISHFASSLEELKAEKSKLGTDSQASDIEGISASLESLRLAERTEFGESDSRWATRSDVPLEQAVQSLAEKMSDIALTSQRLRQEQSVVASLTYQCRPVRHEAIPEAHGRSFHWAFHSNFAAWLKSGTGIFWVTGKPGSGKSTLTKFLASHETTKRLLGKWAPSTQVTITAHYFWSAGSPIQRSLQGALRTLLYEIFRQCPFLIPRVCPNRWAAATHSDWSAEPWTMSELSASLRAVVSMDDLSHNFCFFVDGMDEFDGDMMELCDVLQGFAKSHRVKLCLSSRPWNVFEDYFGGDKSKTLAVHELTSDDIEAFARDRLQSHPRWSIDMTQVEGFDQAGFIKEVAQAAEGVFLWVFLVTQDLREGLFNCDTVQDMRNRLKRLPRDLDVLFKHILESVDPFYHEKMAQLLLFTMRAAEPPLVDLYWHAEKGEGADYAIHCPTQIITPEQRLKAVKQAARRINGRSKGLIEVRPNDRVEFLHRTVKDFLLTEQMSDYLSTKLQKKYAPYTAIANAHLAHAKVYIQGATRGKTSELWKYGEGQNAGRRISQLHEAVLHLSWAVRDGESTSEYATRWLDEYEKAFVFSLENTRAEIRAISESYRDFRVPFREEILKHDLAFYVERKLRNDRGWLICDAPPLVCALRNIQDGIDDAKLLAPCHRIIEILLEHGENPGLILNFSPADRILKRAEFLPGLVKKLKRRGSGMEVEAKDKIKRMRKDESAGSCPGTVKDIKGGGACDPPGSRSNPLCID